MLTSLMRWPLFLPLLVAFALPPHADAAPGRGGTTKLPRCLRAMADTAALADYASYLGSHSNVLRASNPCQYPSALVDRFLAKLATAESTGLAPAAPLPASYLTKMPGANGLNLTRDEGYEILAAKLAHILYVEVRGLVPWSIADYDTATLESLFDLCKGLGCSFGGRKAEAHFRFDYVADHSPRVVWDLLRGLIDVDALADPAAAVIEILRHGRQFRHGGSGVDPDLGIITVDEMAIERVARQGCWSMTPYVVSLAAALNVPGDLTYGYYDGRPHRTVLLPAIDGVLGHGDDVYNGSLRNVPLSHLLDSYQRWMDDVLRYEPLEGPSSPAGYNSKLHNYEMARRFPASWTMARYCGYVSAVAPGRAFLEAFFEDYATPADLDDLELRILETTGGCSVVPEDGAD